MPTEYLEERLYCVIIRIWLGNVIWAKRNSIYAALRVLFEGVILILLDSTL